MASLYEIDKSILTCCDMETGEILDPERLDGLMMEREQKCENIALYIKNLQADALAYEAEKNAFAEREKAAKGKVEQLKKYLAYALGGEKFSTSKCAVSFRRSEKVDITDKSLIPVEFFKTSITYEPDKTAIKKAIKDGQEVGGCQLIESLNPQIK